MGSTAKYHSPIHNLLPFGGEVFLFENLFSVEESENYLIALERDVPWKHEPIKFMGKMILQPRLTAWYGDADKDYKYSGVKMTPLAWTPHLIAIKEKVENASNAKFNSALLNQYRDGNDSVGWHRDNEKGMGSHPTIGSVSFGATRKFQLRPYKGKGDMITINLTHGSLLLMQGDTQNIWAHQVPKTKQIVGPRINITFRFIIGQ